LDITAAAAGIIRVTTANMVLGIHVVSVERGHDRRCQTLVPFCGAGGMHGSLLAHDLAIPCLPVRPTPGLLQAWHAGVGLRHDLMQTRLAPHPSFDPAKVQRILDPMLADGKALLDLDRERARRCRGGDVVIQRDLLAAAPEPPQRPTIVTSLI
jgi:N-methylhydantoinase A/oxoprolinase/acetone carboxylase beta subunit